MKPRVYIETSIPSFYYETRDEPEMVARRQWTRTWWKTKQSMFELVTIEAVLFELNAGDFPSKALAIELIESIPLLPIEDPISEIVEAYVKHHAMPADPLVMLYTLLLRHTTVVSFLLHGTASTLQTRISFHIFVV